MRSMLIALPLLAVTTAQAGDKTPPGLQKVCKEIVPEVTTSEVLASAYNGGLDTPCDHPAYSDGTCQVVLKGMAITSDSSLAVALVDPLTAVPEKVDEPLYVATSYAPDFATEPVTLWVDGKLLLDDVVLGEPLRITGYVEPSETTKGLVHIVEAHGKTITFPATADDTIKEDALSVTSTDTGSGSFYTITADEGGGDDSTPVRIEIDLEVTFGEGVGW